MSGADINDLRRRMTGAMDMLKKEMTGLRTGRASANLLEPVQVDAYGNTMPLNQVGTVGVPEPRMLTVQVWDKGLVKAVEKAIRDANLGVNPMADGQLIRVPVPALTEDRRKELIKIAHKYAEQARIAVRNVRRDGMDALKQMEKDGKITEDEHRKRGTQIQSLTDEFIKKIDEGLAAKEKDVMHV
ncbi:MAG: ribosome recycling factor [Rhodospirillales bacterium]|nr:ribosome recycling factor [Rhodospirillales bacterium]